MCGFAGYVSSEALADSNAVLERMTNVIAHRGPDGFGYHADAHAKIGHRRLSIVDLAGGAQPMYSADRRLVIAYNGEVYNHADLRVELEQKGREYRTRSDTETILHGFDEYGEDCVKRLRGMYSFVVWDSVARRLFAARDRMGIKPLYYFFDGRLFLFGSEIKAILEHPAVTPELETDVLPEYLGFGYVSEERTLFRNVKQLPPGCSLTLEARDGGLELRRRQYWDIPASDPSDAGEEALTATCRRTIEESVQLRLMSDVPLGMFLSGGVDSSTIAAVMKRLRSEPVETFSVGYSEERFSELGFARDVAEHIGTKHHEVAVSEKEFFDALPGLIWHEDEPITWPSSVPLYFVSRLAADRVKVVLTGEGSDELFGGYARYRHYLRDEKLSAAYGRVPDFLRRAIRGGIAASSLLSADLRRKLQHTVLGREAGVASLYFDNYFCAFSQAEIDALTARPASGGDIYRNHLAHWDESRKSLLSRLLFVDQKTYLVELLRKQDRMSMAASIESRVPFLDHHLVEFSTGVPDALKIKGRVGKHIAKQAAAGLLPERLIHRTKMGFPTPLTSWLRQPSAETTFRTILDGDGLLSSLVDKAALNRLIDDHRRGAIDGTDRIWRLLNLQLWGDLFLTGRAEKRLEGWAPISRKTA